MKRNESSEAYRELRRVLAPYFELAVSVPELLVEVPTTFEEGGTKWPVLKMRLSPGKVEARHRLVVVAGLSAFDRGSVDAVFHAVLRLLQQDERLRHTELVAFPVANPVALAQIGEKRTEEVLKLLGEELRDERYDGLLVLHDDPVAEGLAFRLIPEESSLNLAADLLQRVPLDRVASSNRLSPLERDDLEPKGANEGSAAALHARLPLRFGRAEAARLGADLILGMIDEIGAIDEMWRRTA